MFILQYFLITNLFYKIITRLMQILFIFNIFETHKSSYGSIAIVRKNNLIFLLLVSIYHIKFIN